MKLARSNYYCRAAAREKALQKSIFSLCGEFPALW
jgi:hypothetical protein